LFGAGSLVLIQNLALLATFPLAGLGAYCLVRHLTGNDAAGLAGGFVFAFNPSHIAHGLHHANISSIEFMPFFVLAYLLALERKSVGWLACSAVLWALNGLACLYYLFYAGFFVVFHTVYLTVRDRALPKGWRLAVPLISALGAALLMSPLVVPMLHYANDPAAYAGGSNVYVADLVALFLPPVTHLAGAWTEPLYARMTGNSWESAVYLGLVNVAVLVFLGWRALKTKDPLIGYAFWGIAVFLILAAGDHPHVLGHIIDFVRGVKFSHIPLLANLRAPSRTIVLVYLFVAIAVGRAVALGWHKRHQPLMATLLSVGALLALVDFYPARVQMTPVVCPAGLSVLRADPDKTFGVLDLPNGHAEGTYFMMLQHCHGRPIAQGVVSRQLYPTLADRLEMGDLDKQRRQLETAKIKYIVIHKPLGELFAWPQDGADRAAYAKTYKTVRDNSDLTILRVY
jgi:hypothetical protein